MRIVVALAILAVASASVVVLDGSNFDSVVNGDKHVFVEFFAPWCGHCKNLAPDWERLAETFGHSKDVVIASVDADAHKELGSRFGVTGFPTLKFFPKGSTTPKDYKGGRSLDDLVSHVNSEAGTSARAKKPATAVTILTQENFDSIVNDDDNNVLVEFFAPWCGHCKSLAPEYEKAAKAFKNEPNCIIASVDATVESELGTKFGVSGYPTIKFFADDDKSGDISYDGARDVAGIVKFMNEKCGTSRTVTGELNDEAGRIEDLDEIAEDFLEGDAASQQAAIAKATAIAGKADADDAKSAQFYVHAMKKLAAQSTYAATELTRLNRMIESGSVTPDKIDEFTKRKNILNVFVNEDENEDADDEE